MIGRARAWLFQQPYVLLPLTMLMWAGNAVASRLAVGQVSPMSLVVLRWLIVCVVLAVVARRAVAADWPLLRPRLGFIALMGALGFTAFNVLFYVAAYHTTAVNIAILQGAIPMLVLAGAFLAYGTPISTVQLLGVLATMLGVTVLATQGELARLLALDVNFGDLLMIVAAVLYAGYTVGLRNRPKVSGLGFFTATAVAATVISLPLLAVEIARGEATWPTATGWLIVLYVAFFPSMLAQIFFMRSVELIGPGRAGLFVNLVPVFGPLLAVAVLGEPFGLFHAIALGLVLGGIMLAEYRRGL